jgi:glycine hydroxymethyltransferase
MFKPRLPLPALESTDPDIHAVVMAEDRRQQEHLELIASENHGCAAVMQAVGSVLTDKYAEGYPGRRWYGGCAAVDQAEALAVKRAKKLFGAEHANVQPHSGAQANMAAYMAVLKPHDKILGMSLNDGGHLTHGHHANFSAQIYNVVSYGLDDAGHIDYDEVQRLAHEQNPDLIVAGASSYSRTIDFERFAAVAQQVGARLMVDMAHIAGLVAAGVHPSPVPYADIVTSTTHKTLRGPRGGFILCRRELARAIDSAVFPGIQGGPLMHVIAGKAVSFKLAGTEEFRTCQRQVVVNAAAMADEFIKLGFNIVSGGTDNHLLLLDLTSLDISGKVASALLGRANITVNKNVIPNDQRPPTENSGIRIGTPAITTRGMGEAECRRIAHLIAQVLRAEDEAATVAEVQAAVLALCAQFPVPV